jgi:K+-transporting ATPase ATPase A chain
MNLYDWLQIIVFFAVLLVSVKPLGGYMAGVFSGEKTVLSRWLLPVEKFIYRLSGIAADEEMNWKQYSAAMLAFNALGFVFLYGLLRLQDFLPLNPQQLGGVAPDLAFNAAASFVTNTNWQSYSGETTLSYLSQMLGLTVQNFLSAASGMAVFAALARAFKRQQVHTIGNFFADLTRATLYIFLPLALVLALVLVSQGVVQTFLPYREAAFLQPFVDQEGQVITTQTIAVGPAASQVAIKQLGTNGGGFFGVNSSHPFENPTPLSNFLEMLSILLIPAALCYTFGRMVGDTRQGWALLAAMLGIFVLCLSVSIWSEFQVQQAYTTLGIDGRHTLTQPGGNMEGKEVRFGIVNSALWSVATTAASNGSVNSMHDSYNPLGGMLAMWLMQLGEVVFGGVGSGLYGLLIFALMAVFVAGLMVGRTPEYLGKKIETLEVKMAALVILLPLLLVLLGTAAAVMFPYGKGAITNPGPHGFSQVLYAFSSAANNNGSAFAGLGTNNLFYNLALGLAMLIGRYGLAVPVLVMAGSLAGKKIVPPGAGTLPTHTALFIGWLICVVVIVGALSFLPALALGPITEHLLVFH